MKQLRRSLSIILCLLCLITALGTSAAAQEASSAAETPSQADAQILPGDVNQDGRVSAGDARLALRGAARLIRLPQEALMAADTDGNGKLTARDSRLILAYSAQMIAELCGQRPPRNPVADPTTTLPVTERVCMLGDSLALTLANCNFSAGIDFYAKVSLHVDTFLTAYVQGSDRRLPDEVVGRNYDKIIIMVGMNDANYDDFLWASHYGRIIYELRERAPDAVIYCHAILPITDWRSRENTFGQNNEAILRKNKLIEDIADANDCRFIDAGEVLRNSHGALNADAAVDGVHLNYDYCRVWNDWLTRKLSAG